jgi:esterase/lipase superfamily enzyme
MRGASPGIHEEQGKKITILAHSMGGCIGEEQEAKKAINQRFAPSPDKVATFSNFLQ